MKFTFDENKINIFTMIPYGEAREKDYVIRKCIETWKKIPNSVIYLFDIQDVKDTFPGMVENDRYYKIFNNEYLKPNEEPTEEVSIYESHWWLNPIEYVRQCDCVRKERNLSTDILRLKLLQEIPNSVYMDSDAYINDVEGFLKTFNDPRNAHYKLKYQSNCFFCVKKGKMRSKIIDKLISFYEDIDIPVQIDHSIYLAFKATCERSSMDNDRDKFLFNCFDNPYQFRDIPYVTHLFSIKRSLRTIHNQNTNFCKKRLVFNNISYRIHILKNDVRDLGWFDNFMWKPGSSELMQTHYNEFINKISCDRKNNTNSIIDLVFVDFIFTVSSKLFNLENGTISIPVNPVKNDINLRIYAVDSLRQMYNSYGKNDFKEMFIREFVQNLLFDNCCLKFDDFKTYTITKCDNAEDFYIIDDNQNWRIKTI